MLFKFILFFGILLFTSLSGYITTQVLPRADEAFRIATATCDAIMFAMALSVLIRHRHSGVVRWLLFFLVAATLTVIFNLDQLSLLAQVNGLRQPLFVLSSLVVMYDLLSSDRSGLVMTWMDRFLIVFAIAQLPLSLYQFATYGAGDAVGGTYGLTGGSGNITVLLFVIAFYLLVRYGSTDDGESFAVSRIIPFSLLLAPVALNETKIAFVFLAMFLGFLVLSRRKSYKAIPILALGALLIYVLNEMYTEAVRDPSTFMMNQEFLERYLVYDPRPGMDIPRFQKLMIMFGGMGKNLAAMVLGYGYGLFVGENILGKSMYVKSFWYTAGTRPSLFSIWMQGGVLAVIGMSGAVFSFLFHRLSDAAPTVKRFRWFLVVIMGIALVYNEAWLNRPFAIIFAYLSTWLVLQASESETEPSEAEAEQSEELSVSSDDAQGELAGPPGSHKRMAAPRGTADPASPMSRMKTLVVVNQIQYGYHTPWYFFCKYLRSRFKIVYVCWDYGYPHVPDDGVAVRYVHRTGPRPARLWRFLAASMRELSENPGAVKVVRYFRGASILRLAEGTGRMVFDVRSGSVLRSPLRRTFEDTLIRFESVLYRHITILSKDLIPYLRLPERKCHVVPLGGEPMGLEPRVFNGLHLMYIGTFLQREIHKTVEGFAAFARSMPPSVSLSYDVIGDGPGDDLQKIDAAIRGNGLEGRVRCHGRVAYTRLSDLASRCNVGVAFVPLNDYFRSQPVTKVYEYLLAGMPVVATENPQVLSVLNGSNGVLHGDTPEGFAKALRTLWERRDSYDSARIAGDAGQYSWETIVHTNLGPYLEQFG